MPSRKEIAEWLREAGRVEVALARLSGAGKGAEDFAKPWEQRAAKIEGMQCETCKLQYLPHASAFQVPCPWKDSSGCFHHENNQPVKAGYLLHFNRR